ncbi:hypothetical protein HYY70_00715 [Candidatus Woesearchaeota archaeon]|nr:hypothetical protein [Candidatus Woesearchaeota archaeon]
MVGNLPNFTKFDILRCFLRFSGKVSRQELAKELELGEGTVRTILKSLKSKKLLQSTKKGHFLSEKGSTALKQILDCISLPKIITINSLYHEYKKVAVAVRNCSIPMKVYQLRDLAVKNGADGALILKFQGKLFALESGYEQDYRKLEKDIELKDNDILVVSFSSYKRNAENSALAVAGELNSFLKKFINGF